MASVARGGWGAALLAGLLVSCVIDTEPRAGGRLDSVGARIEAHHPQAAALLSKARGTPERVQGGFRLATPPPPAPIRGPAGVWRSTAKGIEAVLPATSDGTMVVSVPSLGHAVRVRRAYATGSAAAVDGQALAWSEASPGVDSLVFATVDSIEELLVVKSASAQVGYDLELPRGWAMRPGNGYPNIIELMDDAAVPRLRMQADKAWDAAGQEVRVAASVEGSRIRIEASGVGQWPVVVDPTWTATGQMAFPRGRVNATLLSTGKVLVSAGNSMTSLREAELYDPATGAFTLAGANPLPPYFTSTLLPSGNVLLAGNNYPTLIYHPDVQGGAGTYSSSGAGTINWVGYASTLLRSGKVLFLLDGGVTIYDPNWDQFHAIAGPSWIKAALTTRTLLPDGRVLLVGGNGAPYVKAATLFDETLGGGTGGFASTGSMAQPRSGHSAVAMRNGKVLVVGGCPDASTSQCNVQPELYDPSTGTFTLVPAPPQRLALMFSLALLPSGGVLAAGDDSSVGTAAQLFDPSANGWTASGPMVERHGRTAITVLASGHVLVVGNEFTPSRSAEVFDPAVAPAGGLAPTGGMAGTGTTTGTGTYFHATMLASGKVLVTGGDVPNNFSEVYDSATGAFVTTGAMSIPRQRHTTTLLPSGKVLVTGGRIGPSPLPELSAAELFDPGADAGKGAYVAIGHMGVPRSKHGAALLASGKVLIAGAEYSSPYGATAELYDPSTGTFVPTGDIPGGEAFFFAVALADGRALVLDSTNSPPAVFDPTTNGGIGAFLPTSALNAERGEGASAALLARGKVLLAGGGGGMTEVELFNPLGNGGTGTFEAGGNMAQAGINPALVVLPSGKALIAGGDTTSSLEVYDPLSGLFAAAASPTGLLRKPTAFLLPNGKVLTVGQTLSTFLWSDTSVGQDAWRPVLSLVSTTVTAGQPDSIGGSGFWPSLESGDSCAANHPVALWMPYQGGGPILSSLSNWSDTSATWTPPITALHGHGLLFISVNGISSNGAPVKLLPAANGARCTSWAQCASRHCTDGVCCDTDCAGQCKACSAAKKGTGADGSCGAIAAGQDPDSECAIYPPESCMETGACDGTGKCALQPGGTVCVKAFCSGEVLSPAYMCDGAGSCKGTGIVPCSPYLCNGSGSQAACTVSCSIDTECASGAYCKAGACSFPQTNGKGCASSTECQSGYCADNVCCNASCTASCMACSVAAGAASEGICAPVTSGKDPGNDCSAEQPSTCGRTGNCNGSGGCELYPVGASCGDTQCTDHALGEHSVQTSVACDGFGKCASNSTMDCGSYRCAGPVCLLACASSADCIETTYCSGSGECVPKSDDGAACTSAAQCASGFCADKVCCSSSCADVCMTCAGSLKASGSDGICGPVKKGTDPDNNCEPTNPNQCKNNGSCDGSGACQLYEQNTPCGTTTCADKAFGSLSVQKGYACDGFGQCNPNSSNNCGEFKCSGNACAIKCVTDDDCLETAYCNSAKVCVTRQANGAGCVDGPECASRFCVDGVCCENACAGTCEACNEDKGDGGFTGRCIPISGPPRGGRPACKNAQAECGGSCDGNSTECTFPNKAQSCGTASCTQGKQYQAFCNGQGACGTPQPTDCVNFACGATACKTECTADTDCAAQYKCDTSTKDCIPVGAKCDGDHTLKNNDEVVKDCAPYRCTTGNVCLNACTSRADCVSGMTCTADGKCEPDPATADQGGDGGCGCRMGREREAPAWWVLMLAAVAIGARRRRRSPRLGIASVTSATSWRPARRHPGRSC
jgi:MYXO-CTERM domain-containing protein